jgi:hypothetical protein
MRFHCLRRSFRRHGKFSLVKEKQSHRVIPSSHPIDPSSISSIYQVYLTSIHVLGRLQSAWDPAPFCRRRCFILPNPAYPRSSIVDLNSRIFSGLGLHPSHLVKLASSRTCSTGHLVCALRPSVVGKYRHRCLCFGHSRFVLDHRLSTHCHLRQVALPGLRLWVGYSSCGSYGGVEFCRVGHHVHVFKDGLEIRQIRLLCYVSRRQTTTLPLLFLPISPGSSPSSGYGLSFSVLLLSLGSSKVFDHVKLLHFICFWQATAVCCCRCIAFGK